MDNINVKFAVGSIIAIIMMALLFSLIPAIKNQELDNLHLMLGSALGVFLFKLALFAFLCYLCVRASLGRQP